MACKKLRESRKIVKSFDVEFVETLTGSGHVKFSFKNGTKKGSVILSLSPSCAHALANHKADIVRVLKRIGLLEKEAA